MTDRPIYFQAAGFTVRLHIHDSDLRSECLTSGLCSHESGQVPMPAWDVNDPPITLEVNPEKPASLDPIPADCLLDGYGEYAGMFDTESRHGVVTLAIPAPTESLLSCLRQVCGRMVFARNGLVLHAACMAREDLAYVFAGPSGAGKSTVCELSPRCTILSDDLVAVRRLNGAFRAWGLPTGRSRRFVEKGPFAVRAVFKLVQDARNRLTRLTGARAVAEFAAMPPASFSKPDSVGKMLELVDELADRVPCYELRFRKDPSFWECIEEEMGTVQGSRFSGSRLSTSGRKRPTFEP